MKVVNWKICIHIARMKFTPATLLTAAVALAPSFSHATTITQYANNVQLTLDGDTTYSQFYSFNTNLGTLNSVSFYVDSATLISGSTLFTAGSSFSPNNVTGFTSFLTLVNGTTGTGVYNGIPTPVTIERSITVSDPSIPINGFTVARNDTQTFTFTSNQDFVSSPVYYNVISGDFTANNSAQFAPSFVLNLGISGTGTLSTTANFSAWAANPQADLRLVYEYTAAAVPEPSTYGIGLGVLALAAVAIRRRNKVKA